MAVSTLISVNGVVPPRPIEALGPVQRVGPREDGSPETSARPDRVRDLSQGLGTRERQRIHLMENSERLRELAEQAEEDRALSARIERMETLGAALGAVAQAAQGATDEDQPEEERANFEGQARALANDIGSEPNVAADAVGPEVVTLDNLGFQPDTLGAIEAVRSGADEETSVDELRARAEAAAASVSEARDAVAAERAEALEDPRASEVAVEADRFEERFGLLTSEQARDVIVQIDEQNRTSQGAPLIEQLAVLVPDNVMAVVP